MKKILIVMALMVPVFLMSYSPERASEARISEKAPEVSLKTGDTTLSLNDLRGKFVLLHFWSKSDPSSRVANHFNDRHITLSGRDDIVYVAVCTDKTDESLSRLITLEDDNRQSTQFFQSQLTPADNSAAYTAAGGGTWLVSPEGVILSHNPDINTI